MTSNDKRPRPGQGSEGAKSEAVACNALVARPGPVVNLESPRLWVAYRRFARNHRRIAQLIQENEILVERMRYFQGGPGVDHDRA